MNVNFWNDNRPILESDEFKMSEEYCESSDNSGCDNRDPIDVSNPEPKKMSDQNVDYDFGRLVRFPTPFSKDYCGYSNDDTQDRTKPKSQSTGDQMNGNVATPTTMSKKGKTSLSSDKNGESDRCVLQFQNFYNENCMFRGNEFVDKGGEIYYPDNQEGSFDYKDAQ